MEHPQPEQPDTVEHDRFSYIQTHRYLMLIAGVIVISLFLVSIAMALYESSGAAQVDLSRPGYRSVIDQAVTNDSFRGFPASGNLDSRALYEFRRLYDERAEQATGIAAYEGGVMSDEALSIDDIPAEP